MALSSEVVILRSETGIPYHVFPVGPGSESIKQPRPCIADAEPSDSNATGTYLVRHARVEATDLAAIISTVATQCDL